MSAHMMPNELCFVPCQPTSQVSRTSLRERPAVASAGRNLETMPRDRSLPGSPARLRGMQAHVENAETRPTGTREPLARHGAGLLSVRYRCDEDTREHLKTVELVIRRRSRHADQPVRELGTCAGPSSSRIGLRERALQRRVQSARGWWDPGRKVWYLERDAAERLDLLHRVVGGGV